MNYIQAILYLCCFNLRSFVHDIYMYVPCIGTDHFKTFLHFHCGYLIDSRRIWITWKYATERKRERDRERSSVYLFQFCKKFVGQFPFLRFLSTSFVCSINPKICFITSICYKSQMCAVVIDICKVVTTHMHLFWPFLL